jgi:hypothetical protein
MDDNVGVALMRFFWVVLAGLVGALVATVYLLRSGRSVPGPLSGGSRTPHTPSHALRPPPSG